MILSDSIRVAKEFDKLIRAAARRTSRLPKSTPVEQFYDDAYGMGLRECQIAADSGGYSLALRILNSPHLPVRALVLEQLELYQIQMGLTECPLAEPIRPPACTNMWITQVIRIAATQNVPIQCVMTWKNLTACQSTRP